MIELFRVVDIKHIDLLWLSEVDQSSPPIQHSFGGARQHRIVMPVSAVAPLHLLYTLDLSDDSVGVTIPGVRWLPLLYAFHYEGSPMYYKVVSNSDVQVIHLKSAVLQKDFPFPDYPDEFPFRWIEAKLGNFDEVFEELLEFEDESRQDLDAEEWNDHNNKIAVVAGLPQGTLQTKCIDPSCNGATMTTLAVIRNEPVSGVSLWGEWGEYVRIIYEVCSRCKMIFTTNQCT